MYYSINAQIDNILTSDFDVQPSCKEGVEDVRNIIQKNLKYPEIAAEQNISGEVIVAFIIQPNGEIKDIIIINSIHPLLDEEAIRVIKLTSGYWIPGEKDGQKVDSYYEFPINFCLGIESLDYYYNVADKYFENANYKNAIKYLEEIRKREPYNFEVLMKLAISYEQIGMSNHACIYWKRLFFLKQDVAEKKIHDCNLDILIGEDKAINNRFDGKEEGFRSLLNHNLRYPEKSANNNVIGFSISSITITPNGDIEKISIINSIDIGIDNEVHRLLKMTEKYWLENDTITTNQTFYVQIGFDIDGTLINSELQNSKVKNMFFIEPVYVSAISMFSSKKTITDTNLTIRCDNIISKGKYAEALPLINDLIKRHPYCKEFYQIRIMIYRKLNETALINEDIQRINNFIPGVSLDELLKSSVQINEN